MSRLVVFTAVFAAILMAMRFFKREKARVPAQLRRAKEDLRNGAKRGTLVQDSRTGEYYVKRD